MALQKHILLLLPYFLLPFFCLSQKDTFQKLYPRIHRQKLVQIIGISLLQEFLVNSRNAASVNFAQATGQLSEYEEYYRHSISPRVGGIVIRNYSLRYSRPSTFLTMSLFPNLVLALAYISKRQLLILAMSCLITVTFFILRTLFLRQRNEISMRTKLESELTAQRLEAERTKTEMQRQALKLEMQVLRAQMNPHFIFNSLNSINRFILQNKQTEASKYLIKFSRLIRLIMQNSQSALIPLKRELDALRLYLELEAIRFDNHFKFTISLGNNTEVYYLKVPPLIFQPYVENAIWHGLMHKEEKGALNIEVNQENSSLIIKIQDDGIGRKMAAKVAGKSATRHQPMGLQITAERITMLQDPNGNESSVTINDLVGPDGSAMGTEVIIRIPVLYD